MKPSDEIQSVLDSSQFAILATQYEGQPHASLMAFTPLDGLRHLIVATYRATRKYRNLLKDGRVAMLIDSSNVLDSAKHRSLVVTAHGVASEVPSCDRKAAEQAHLARHTGLSVFLASPDCALLRVTVTAYEVVGGTDDVLWYKVADVATA
jgi:nitroimidazol reductase NimA-like FMN-containing flavoprotein (pyridoxamine 5'-phosphate oxidase superfamily)